MGRSRRSIPASARSGSTTSASCSRGSGYGARTATPPLITIFMSCMGAAAAVMLLACAGDAGTGHVPRGVAGAYRRCLGVTGVADGGLRLLVRRADAGRGARLARRTTAGAEIMLPTAVASLVLSPVLLAVGVDAALTAVAKAAPAHGQRRWRAAAVGIDQTLLRRRALPAAGRAAAGDRPGRDRPWTACARQHAGLRAGRALSANVAGHSQRLRGARRPDRAGARPVEGAERHLRPRLPAEPAEVRSGRLRRRPKTRPNPALGPTDCRGQPTPCRSTASCPDRAGTPTLPLALQDLAHLGPRVVDELALQVEDHRRAARRAS